jgi:hypothetical protein
MMSSLSDLPQSSKHRRDADDFIADRDRLVAARGGVPAPSSGGLHSVQPISSDQVIRDGERALDELPTATKDQIWHRWMLVAAALEAAQREAMFAAQTNEPAGAKYARAYNELVKRHRFDRINKSDRSRLLECLRHRAEIEKWLDALPTNKRLRIVHPLVILRNWKASLPPDPGAPKPEPKPSPKQRLERAHAEALEKIHRLEREIKQGGGDLWGREDRPADIARIMVGKLAAAKAERVAREMLKLLGAAKAGAGK